MPVGASSRGSSVGSVCVFYVRTISATIKCGCVLCRNYVRVGVRVRPPFEDELRDVRDRGAGVFL